MIWGAFIGVAVLTAASVALTITVLQMEQRNEFLIVRSRSYIGGEGRCNICRALR